MKAVGVTGLGKDGKGWPLLHHTIFYDSASSCSQTNHHHRNGESNTLTHTHVVTNMHRSENEAKVVYEFRSLSPRHVSSVVSVLAACQLWVVLQVSGLIMRLRPRGSRSGNSPGRACIACKAVIYSL